MDQQIKLFLAFLEQCRLQSRVSSTRDTLLCLDDLQRLLETIEQSLISGNHGQEPSLLYPSLGSLLEHICRNPVTLASSEAIPRLATSLILKYSQTSRSSIRDKEKILWCSDRLDDLLRTNTLPSLSAKLPEARFQDIFKVTSDDLQEQLVLETLKSMTICLENLQRALDEQKNSATYPRILAKWMFDLSDLCAPLLFDHRTVPITEQIVSTAYKLNTAKPLRPNTQILSENFIDGVIAQQRDLEPSDKVSDTTMNRHRSLTQLLDTIIKSSAAEPDFFRSQKDLSVDYFERSRLLRSATMPMHNLGVGVSRPEIGSLLEDMAGWLGEIPDWRLMRIGTAMVAWMIDKHSSAMTKELVTGDVWTNYSTTQLNEMLVSAIAVVEQARQMVDQILVKELEDLSQAQSTYIYSGGDSAHLAMRRRLAFMVSMAIAQRDNFLVRCVRIYLSDLREVPSNSKAILGFMSLLFLGNDNAGQLSSVAEQIQECLQRLQAIFSPHVGKHISETSQLSTELISTLERFEDILLLNTTVAADIVCGLWLYLDQDEAAGLSILHPMIDVIVRLPKASVTDPDPSPSLSSSPFIIRLRDILDSCALPGLDIALAPFLQ
ncbi:hypothetical protein CPC16_000881 [Podila verticillata]|nr:hypothetical protein CPC16_000881 [Podila verticillata]